MFRAFVRLTPTVARHVPARACATAFVQGLGGAPPLLGLVYPFLGQGGAVRKVSSVTNASSMRINKAVAKLLKISRRDAEKYVLGKRVQKNGVTVTELSERIRAADKIAIDGTVLRHSEEVLSASPRLWICHKLTGELVTMDDPGGRPTIFNRLEKMGLPYGLKAVGRLDYNTSGLILLTNDGDLKRTLEHPRQSKITRTYRVTVKGVVRPSWLNFLRKGAKINGTHYRPMQIEVLESKKSESFLEVALEEGKKNEIRRALSAGGLHVNKLVRVEFGPYHLGQLKPGDVLEVGVNKLDGVLTQQGRGRRRKLK